MIYNGKLLLQLHNQDLSVLSLRNCSTWKYNKIKLQTLPVVVNSQLGWKKKYGDFFQNTENWHIIESEVQESHKHRILMWTLLKWNNFLLICLKNLKKEVSGRRKCFRGENWSKSEAFAMSPWAQQQIYSVFSKEVQKMPRSHTHFICLFVCLFYL